MDEEQNTSAVMSTAGSLNNSNTRQSLLATSSGTSTQNARNRQSTGSTVNDAGLGLIPIYTSLNRQHRTTHDTYPNQSPVMNSNDYEYSEESGVNFDSSGAQIQVSNSRTHQTPFGPVRNSVGVQMSLSLGRLIMETNMSSSIIDGNGRFFLFSSGRSSQSPFSPFGQTLNRYIPLGIFASPFRGMFLSRMSSTSHRSEHFPFETMRTFDDLNPQNEHSSNVSNYHGPIITELSNSDDDDDDDEKDYTGDDKRRIEGKESSGEIDHLTVNNDKQNERLKSLEQIGNASFEDLKEFDSYNLIPNSSVTILNREDLDDKLTDTFCGFEGSAVCDVYQSAQSKNENNKVEDKHTEPYKNVDPNQSVLIDTNFDREQIDKPSGRRKRKFRTKSFVNTTLAFADMDIIQSESNQEATENHVSSLELGISDDVPISMKLKSEKNEEQNVAEDAYSVHFRVDLNASTRSECVEESVNTRGMSIDNNNDEHEIISDSIEGDKCSVHVASFMNTDEREEGPDSTVPAAAQSLNRLPESDIDDYECNKYEINDPTGAGRDACTNKSESDIPLEISDFQDLTKDGALDHSENNADQLHPAFLTGIINSTKEASEIRKQMQQNATNQESLLNEEVERQYPTIQMSQYHSLETNNEIPRSAQPDYKSPSRKANENADRPHKTSDIKGNHHHHLHVTHGNSPKMQQQHVHLHPETSFHTCPGHSTKNGRQFLINTCVHSFEKSHTRQQSCTHDIVYMYHTCINTKAYMCATCGLTEHIMRTDNDEHCSHCHQHGHEHVDHLSDEFYSDTQPSTKQIRNKNASVEVNKVSLKQNSEQMLPTYSTSAATNNTTMTETNDVAKDKGQYGRYWRSSSGLSALVQSVGLILKDVIPDGNCLFNAITDQLRIRGDFSFTAKTLRSAAVEYLRNNPSQEDGTPLVAFLDEYEGSWDEYLDKMSSDGHWGDHIVVYALAHVVDKRIVIYRGNNELTRTVVEPRGKMTNAETCSPVSDAGGSEEQRDTDTTVDEMHLGHVSDSHYVSLRSVNWKEKLMQELKNKKTSAIIGCNRKSIQIGCNSGISGTRGSLQNSPFDEKFLINFIKRGNFFEHKHQQDFSLIGRSHMTVNQFFCDQFETYRFNTRHKKPRDITAMTYFVSPTDTKVRQVHTEAAQKDLIACTEGVSVGKLKLRPEKPYLWKSLIVPVGDVSFVKHASVKSSHNLPIRQNDTVILAYTSEWPVEANEWKSRERESGWPDSNLCDRVFSGDVHVIPATDSDDSSNDVWEYNFNKAEFRLYRNIEIEYQSLCCLLKHVVEIVFCGRKMIQNQHLSALVLYMFEKITMEDVESLPAKCLLHIFDEMLEHLKNGHFPCYFIRGKNLISGMSYTDRAWHIDRLNILKKHLIVCLYFMLDEAELTGEYFDFENVLCGLTEAAFNKLSIENVGNSTMESNLAYLVPLAVRGIHKWVKASKFARAREMINVWLTDLVENCHQVGLSKDVLTHDVLFSLPDSDKWLFAFYIDFTDGTNTLECVCDGHECTSISILYGKDVVPLLQMETAFRGDDLFVPTRILLGENLVSFARKLRTVMLAAGENETIYQEAIHYFLKANTNDLLLRIERERKDEDYTAEYQLRDLLYLYDDLYLSFKEYGKLHRYRDLMDTYEKICNYYADEKEFIKLSELWDWFGETERAQEADVKASLVHIEKETYV